MNLLGALVFIQMEKDCIAIPMCVCKVQEQQTKGNTAIYELQWMHGAILNILVALLSSGKTKTSCLLGNNLLLHEKVLKSVLKVYLFVSHIVALN